MSFTYDLTTARGKVRLMIADRRPEPNNLFDDDEIDAFLAMEDNSIRLASAQALETIATNETLVLKRIETLDLKTDGPAVADSLMKLAASWREQEASVGAFDIAEQVFNDFGERERIYKQAQRGAL